MDFGHIVEQLPEHAAFHATHTPYYEETAKAAAACADAAFGEAVAGEAAFGPFGQLVFPYEGMGAISSLNLFGLDELILFSFYWSRRNTYRTAVDLGANLGLHSIIMARCGYHVTSYEPDPHHFELLSRNLAANGCKTVNAVNAAVSDEAGTLPFVRVLGNTTSSHLVGSKKAPYGELETFDVPVVDIADFIGETDFLKMDVEGHESRLIRAVSAKDWQGRDAMIEIGTAEAAAEVFDHFAGSDIQLFAQRLGWGRVGSVDDMPTSYKDGSLFLSGTGLGPWDGVPSAGG